MRLTYDATVYVSSLGSLQVHTVAIDPPKSSSCCPAIEVFGCRELKPLGNWKLGRISFQISCMSIYQCSHIILGTSPLRLRRRSSLAASLQRSLVSWFLLCGSSALGD